MVTPNERHALTERGLRDATQEEPGRGREPRGGVWLVVLAAGAVVSALAGLGVWTVAHWAMARWQ